MSRVVMGDECMCSCHRTGGIHAFACCDGQCRICQRWIARGRMKEHAETHRPPDAEARTSAATDEGCIGSAESADNPCPVHPRVVPSAATVPDAEPGLDDGSLDAAVRLLGLAEPSTLDGLVAEWVKRAAEVTTRPSDERATYAICAQALSGILYRATPTRAEVDELEKLAEWCDERAEWHKDEAAEWTTLAGRKEGMQRASAEEEAHEHEKHATTAARIAAILRSHFGATGNQ